MDIKQSKAIISGGASGLGFATAENIINKGGKVVLLDINKDGEKSAKSLGNSATYIQVDISVEDEVKAAIQEAKNFLDGINLAVNCAGVIGAARALGRDGTMDANFFERTIKINLIGSFILAKESSKAGIVGMTLPLAREFARIGIRVNTIAPGIFKTPMVSGMTEALQESLGKQVPFPPRLGNPDEFADLVESIYRNAMINGETIRLDGAIRMQPK